MALSCPASDILNASSGLFSIFKLSQQWGIVFPINIAFWLFTHGQIILYPEEGVADSYIAPKSMLRRNCGRYKPFIWDMCCFQLHVSSAVFAARLGKERSTNETPPRRHESNTAVGRGRSFPCTPVAM